MMMMIILRFCFFFSENEHLNVFSFSLVMATNVAAIMKMRYYISALVTSIVNGCQNRHAFQFLTRV